MQIEEMYNKLCEWLQKEKKILITMNIILTDKHQLGDEVILSEWNMLLEEHHKVSKKIENIREEILIIKAKNYDEMRKHINKILKRKVFGNGTEK